MRKPYYVCGGLQDNGSWCGPSAVRTTAGILNSDWYRDRRRRRVLHRERSDRLDHRLFGVAGRQHQSLRPAHRRDAEHPPENGACGSGARAHGERPDAGRPTACWSTGAHTAGGRPAAGGAAGRGATGRRARWRRPWRRSRQRRPAASIRHELPLLLEHAVHPVAAQSDDGLSRRRTAVPVDDRGDTLDRRRRISRRTSAATTGRSWASTARRRWRRSTTARRRTATSSRSASRRSAPASSGSAPTTATCRSAATAAPPGRTSSRTSRACRRRAHVSRVEPSHFDAGTAYVTFDGHRTDDHKPYVFVTRDFGETWTSIAGNLPEGQRQRDHGGPEEPQPPVPRHRVRLLHLAERRQASGSGS